MSFVPADEVAFDEPGDAEDLVGTEWRLTHIEERDGDVVGMMVVPRHVTSTIRFEDGEFTLDTGCNTGGGAAALAARRDRFGQLVQTLVLAGAQARSSAGCCGCSRARARCPGRSPATSCGWSRVTGGTGWCTSAEAAAGDGRARKYDPGMSNFPLFALSEEHQAIREAVRSVCDAKVAPYAADVDEKARYPREAAEALRRPTSTRPTSPRSTAAPAPTRSRRSWSSRRSPARA